MLKRLLIIVVVVLVAVEMFLPLAVSGLLAKGMTDLTGADDVVVKVQKRPAIFILGGNLDKITADAVNAKTDKIVLNNFHIELSEVALDMDALLERRLILKSVSDISVTAAVTQEELARYLNNSVKGIKNAKVTIRPDKVEAGSSFNIGGFASVAAVIEGKIVGDGQKIKFVTDKFILNGLPTGKIGGTTLTEIQLVDLKSIPFPVRVRSVVMEEGRVVINADNR